MPSSSGRERRARRIGGDRNLLAVVVASCLLIGLASSARADSGTAKEEFQKGQELFAEQDFRGALVHYSAAYDADDIPAFLFNMAQCHRNLGEYRKARDKFREYLDESEESPPNEAAVEQTLRQLGILRKAQKHVRARRYDKAIELFDRALEIEQLAPVHRDRGRSHERLGQYDEAIGSYRDYLEELPEAEDAEDIEAAIERLEKEIKGAGVGGLETTPAEPVYKQWWFWGGVAGVVATAIVVSVVVADDGIPGSDLGNIGFEK